KVGSSTTIRRDFVRVNHRIMSASASTASRRAERSALNGSVCDAQPFEREVMKGTSSANCAPLNKHWAWMQRSLPGLKAEGHHIQLIWSSRVMLRKMTFPRILS